MMFAPENPSHAIPDALTDEIVRRISKNKRVRRTLPLEGRVNIDRQLPFLFLYRRPLGRWDYGTDRFVKGQASYLIGSDDPEFQDSLGQLVRKLVTVLSKQFGAFVIVELWSSPDNLSRDQDPFPRPAFRVHASKDEIYSSAVEALEGSILETKTLRGRPAVNFDEDMGYPTEYKTLIPDRLARKLNCHFIGLEIKPIYRNARTHQKYPMVRQKMSRLLNEILKKTVFKFAKTQTWDQPAHYQSFGKRALVKAVWQADKRLAKISDSFDLLLNLNPVNSEDAWRKFRQRRYEKDPVFRYPPLPIDPSLFKRKLYAIPVERFEDPVVAEVFREKRTELDRQITLLSDRGTENFLYGSLQLFGGVDNDLLETARKILGKFPARTREDSSQGFFTAGEFSLKARQEIEKYHRAFQKFSASVEIIDGHSSLMVSRGKLYVGKRMKIPKKRARALINHEIGTHMVTYFNALAQPFQMLHCGLAGYDELQEGLAVLAEYLCGGLSRPRLRLLAARVIAVKRLIEGGSFVEIFRMLVKDYDFEQKTAWTITLRVFRGGGLTKDAAYLRGLVALLKYFRHAHSLEILFAGKFSLKHVPIIEDLMWRKVLHKIPLRPFYLEGPEVKERFALLQSGINILDSVGK